jgi:ABC-2 type transport system permease protein
VAESARSEPVGPDVLDSVRLYGRYLAVSARAQMQYRLSFALTSIGQLLNSGIEVIGIWALFQRFGSLSGWTLPQVLLFYATVHLAFSFSDAFARGFDLFGSRMVRTGGFDRILLRPRTTVLQLAGQELAIHRVGRLAQALAVLGVAIWMLDVSWGVYEIGLLFFAIAGGFCLFFGIIVLQATMSFWTTESLEIMNALSYGGVETAQYPMAIYHRYFRRFFTGIVPLMCVSYFPLVGVLGIDDPLGSPEWFQVVSPLAGIVFLLICLRIWRIGVRHYASTGS